MMFLSCKPSRFLVLISSHLLKGLAKRNLSFGILNERKVHFEYLYALQAQSEKVRTSSRVSLRGSVTLEAALIMPLIIFIMYAFLMISQMLIASEEINKGLNETVRCMAKDSYDVDDYSPSMLKAIKLHSYIDKSKVSIVENGVNGIVVLPSIDDNSSVKLDAIYKFHLYIPFFGNYRYTIKDTASARMFNGWDKDRGLNNDEYVYVAETGSVYHTDLNCRYISVRIVDSKSVDLSGKRYCLRCKDYESGSRYVTVCGDCIHKDINCSTLKRTIHLVRKKDIRGLPLCSKCSGGK